MKKIIYEGADYTLGEFVGDILDFFIETASTKTSLDKLLKLMCKYLPKPNNVPSSNYRLLKILEKIMPPKCEIIKKHRICEDCSNYVGEFNDTKDVDICEICNSKKLSGIFIEYNLKSLLKNALECRNLQFFMNEHKTSKNYNKNYITDITDSLMYRSWKNDFLKEESDIVLMWNTDGLPIANSSNGQVWLVQTQVINIVPERRRNFQFVCGVYYSREKKPCMTSFLKPYVDSLKDLFNNGIEWYDKHADIMRYTTVIAPIATLDAPARASVQNIMQFNGQFGCSFCEHPGQVTEMGLGHNRVYPTLNNDCILRTQQRMISQALQATNEKKEHVIGVKGPSITALIPKFDVAVSFVPDYMHAVLLGVFRMLLSLWFNPKYKHFQFYIKNLYETKLILS